MNERNTGTVACVRLYVEPICYIADIVRSPTVSLVVVIVTVNEAGLDCMNFIAEIMASV